MDVDKMVSDLQGLGVFEELLGYWIIAEIGGGSYNFGIYEKSEEFAAKGILMEMMYEQKYSKGVDSKIDEIKSFQSAVDLYNNENGEIGIVVYKMRPISGTLDKTKYSVFTTSSITKLYQEGKKLFSNFDEVMNEDKPEYFNIW